MRNFFALSASSVSVPALAGNIADGARSSLPSSTIDWIFENWIALVVALVLLTAAWTLIPFLVARSRWNTTRAEREAIADRYRGIISRIIAVPLITVPMLAYVDGYLKARTEEAKEAAVRFEQRYRESAMLIDTKTEITQLMGLQGIRRLLDTSTPKQTEPILEALASSLSALSPRSACSKAGKTLTPAAELVLETVSAYYTPGTRAVMRDACLRGASIVGGHELKNADLANSDLSGSDLADIKLTLTNMRFTVLDGASMHGATLTDVGMYCTAGSRARNLAVAALMGNDEVSFNANGGVASALLVDHSYLPDADFSGRQFEYGRIADSCLPAADVYNAHFHGVDIRNVHFERLNGTKVEFASVITDASFDEANLDSADFTKARLEHVSFNGANLSNAHFEGAQLVGTSFDGAILCNTTMPDGRLASPSEACPSFPKLVSASDDQCVSAAKMYCAIRHQ